MQGVSKMHGLTSRLSSLVKTQKNVHLHIWVTFEFNWKIYIQQ